MKTEYFSFSLKIPGGNLNLNNLIGYFLFYCFKSSRFVPYNQSIIKK